MNDLLITNIVELKFRLHLLEVSMEARLFMEVELQPETPFPDTQRVTLAMGVNQDLTK